MLNKQAAETAKQTGMEAAADNAELNQPAWGERALQYIKDYPGNKFLIEDVREWAYGQGLKRPPHERAWGMVVVSAKRLGVIRHTGYSQVSNPRAHGTPASVWSKEVVAQQ